MKKYFIPFIFTLQSTVVFADTDIDKVLSDIKEAKREAKQEMKQITQSTQTKQERLCDGHDGFMRDMIEARKNGIKQEELQLLLFQQFNQNLISIHVLKEMIMLLKGVYIIPDEIMNDEDKLEQFLKDTYWFCVNGQ